MAKHGPRPDCGDEPVIVPQGLATFVEATTDNFKLGHQHR